jgi:hypothetical protein
VPSDVREEAKLRLKQNQQRFPWLGGENEADYKYLTFADYSKIILKNENWKDAFQVVFMDRNAVQTKLRELEYLRNPVAHPNRAFTKTDLDRVKLDANDLTRAIRRSEAARPYQPTLVTPVQTETGLDRAEEFIQTRLREQGYAIIHESKRPNLPFRIVCEKSKYHVGSIILAFDISHEAVSRSVLDEFLDKARRAKTSEGDLSAATLICIAGLKTDAVEFAKQLQNESKIRIRVVTTLKELDELDVF